MGAARDRSGAGRAGRLAVGVGLAAARRLGAAAVSAAVALALVGGLAACSRSDDGDERTASRAPASTTAESDRPAPRPTTAATPTSTTTPAATAPPVPTTISPFVAPSPDPVVEALTQELVGTAADGNQALDTVEARCVSTGLLNRLGTEALVRLGALVGAGGGNQLDVAPLAPAERQALADAVLACIDLGRLLADELVDTFDLPAPSVACVVAALETDGTLGDIVRLAVLEGSDPASSTPRLVGAVTDALRRCLTPEELGRLDLRR